MTDAELLGQKRIAPETAAKYLQNGTTADRPGDDESPSPVCGKGGS